MDSSLTELSRFFGRVRSGGEPLVLATIVRTEGSTYRKAGARMLISAAGETSGLLSGGCLEADLRERAIRVMSRGKPERVVFDSRTTEDPVWGMGVGCEGSNDVWLQAMSAGQGYEPMSYLHECLIAEHAGALATVVGGEALPSELGRHGYPGVRVSDELSAALLEIRSDNPQLHELRHDGRTLEVFAGPVTLPPALLLCGGGPDAVPVAQFADQLGWRVAVIDHRPAFAAAGNFPPFVKVIQGRPDELSRHFRPSAFDAAVIMSHNLAFDTDYLRSLAADAPGYIGLLGPPARRARILQDAGPAVGPVLNRIRGPVGLDIGANTPSSIALSIIAQIHAVLAGRREAGFSDDLPAFAAGRQGSG